MKIKLTILEKDKVYLRRLVEFLNEKYSDNFEIASFSDLTMALEHASEAKIDLLLVGDSFEVDALQVPAKCGIAYLVDSKDIAKYNNMPAMHGFLLSICSVDIVVKKDICAHGFLFLTLLFLIFYNVFSKLF